MENGLEREPSSSTSRSRVIVADRHPIFGQGLRALAQRMTDDISIAAIARSADSLLDSVATEPADVIVLDAHLPPGGGLDVLRELQTGPVQMPTLMLAPAEEIYGAQRALSEGATGLLPRTCTPEELFSAIRSVVAGEVVLAHAAADALLHRNGSADRHLTDAEVQLLDLFSAGLTHSEIARRVNVSESTLKRKFNDIQRKLGARTRVEAVARAARIGLI